MTQALIIEDERLSADRLKNLISKVEPGIEIIGILDSVQSSLAWFRDNSPPDILFLDIQLNDGTGFDLLSQVNHTFPVIFTTAYDNYAIKAFKFNGIDYLLKPIEEKDLAESIRKFKQLDSPKPENPVQQDFGKLQQLISGDFKKRFLVKLGEQFESIPVAEIAYFAYHEGMSYLVSKSSRKFPTDYSMEQLEGLVNPLEFFRVNRHILVTLSGIKEIHSYFNSRLLLNLAPEYQSEVIVSRDRVADFKRWMDI